MSCSFLKRPVKACDAVVCSQPWRVEQVASWITLRVCDAIIIISFATTWEPLQGTVHPQIHAHAQHSVDGQDSLSVQFASPCQSRHPICPSYYSLWPTCYSLHLSRQSLCRPRHSFCASYHCLSVFLQLSTDRAAAVGLTAAASGGESTSGSSAALEHAALNGVLPRTAQVRCLWRPRGMGCVCW